VHDDPALLQIDAGERAAILLPQQKAGALLLIDHAAGRSGATRRGIPSTGTLGILRAAAIRQLLDLPTSLKNLAATNFRCRTPLSRNSWQKIPHANGTLTPKRHLGHRSGLAAPNSASCIPPGRYGPVEIRAGRPLLPITRRAP
jgi:hypothetical protein